MEKIIVDILLPVVAAVLFLGFSVAIIAGTEKLGKGVSLLWNKSVLFLWKKGKERFNKLNEVLQAQLHIMFWSITGAAMMIIVLITPVLLKGVAYGLAFIGAVSFITVIGVGIVNTAIDIKNRLFKKGGEQNASHI